MPKFACGKQALTPVPASVNIVWGALQGGPSAVDTCVRAMGGLARFGIAPMPLLRGVCGYQSRALCNGPDKAGRFVMGQICSIPPSYVTPL